MLVSNIIGRGVYAQGANKGKPFIRVKFNGNGVTIGVTEAIAKEAENKGYAKLKVHGLNDLYPTTKDSTTMNSEGLPIYKAGEKLTVAEYWNRRKALDPTVEPRVLINFDGFLSQEEERLVAVKVVEMLTFA